VKGRDVGFQTTKEGEFWRILLPGIYTMEVFAEGYKPRDVQFAIVEQNPTLLNVTLTRDVSRRKDVVEPVNPVKVNTKAGKDGKKTATTSTKKQPAASTEFDEDLEDDDVDKKEESEEKEDAPATGLFGLTNPFTKIQNNVKGLLNKIPFFG